MRSNKKKAIQCQFKNKKVKYCPEKNLQPAKSKTVFECDELQKQKTNF